jgi:hypothetical protein
MLDDFDRGFFIGLMTGEGSFGGDGKQPQITVRMHVRHEALFRWLTERFPRSKLYGPYDHAGRRYYQWMVRGPALVHDVLPILERHLRPELDGDAAARLRRMQERYAQFIARERLRPAPNPGPDHPEDGPAPRRPG